MTTANAMSIELVKILEAAQAYKEESVNWFNLSNQYEDVDNKLADTYWKYSREAQCKCDAMLQAFEICTGYKVYHWEIEEVLLAEA